MIKALDLGYEIPSAGLCLYIPLREKLFICQLYCAPAHLEMPAESTRGRKLLTAFDMAVLNLSLDMIIDLFIERSPGLGPKADGQFIHGIFSFFNQSSLIKTNSSDIRGTCLLFYFLGSLNELFSDTILLNTRCSGEESFASIQ